jgi:hypothetical protein
VSDTTDRTKLFQYAVIYHPKPTKDQIERGERPKAVIVTDLQTVLAGSAQEVGMLAARSVDEKYIEHLEDVEILVRPF